MSRTGHRQRRAAPASQYPRRRGEKARAAFNVKGAAVAGPLGFFVSEGWLTGEADPLAGLDREPEPKPGDRVRDRSAIDRLLRSTTHPLADRALWSLLYGTPG